MASLQNIIRENRAEIDEAIKNVCSNCFPLNDNDRKEWILNDEGLYRWAMSLGWCG